MARILLVEDEPELATIMSNWLSRSDHSVKVIDHGEKAVSEIKAAKDSYELLILDITLPGCDGFEICQYYRTNKGRAPVMFVSARHALDDKEQAFTLGADDYITKPFDLKEMSLRVAALLRRSLIPAEEILESRDIRMNIAERTVTKSGALVRLTPQEYNLLMFFLKHPNEVFSSDQLLRLAWDRDTIAANDTVRGHIKRLRKKLETPGKPPLIKNLYGFGYRLNK
jgi:DNA-binding response OmpR family regulator